MRITFGPTATIRTAAALLDSARAAHGGDGDVEADCSTLEQCDAAGLQVLLSLHLALDRGGRRLRITHVPEGAVWRFRAMGLERGLN